jgi:hypothetical protein
MNAARGAVLSIAQSSSEKRGLPDASDSKRLRSRNDARREPTNEDEGVGGEAAGARGEPKSREERFAKACIEGKADNYMFV